MDLRRLFPVRIALFMVIIVTFIAALAAGCNQSATPADIQASPQAVARAAQGSMAELAGKVLPCVVYILVDTTETDFFGEPMQAAGSGVILTADGYILTNKHVVEDAKRVEVTLYDRRDYEVALDNIWRDDIVDLAVIKINESNLPALSFGDPDGINIGDWVMAVGNALGLSPIEGGASVTDGIVSNLGRSFSLGDTPYYDLIQTSAAINPGNSGGPLVNMSVEMIGINSVGATSAQNIAFAIGAGTAEHVFRDLVKYGKSHHPYLGVSLGDITPDVVHELNTPRMGALVTNIEPASPAATAGLQENDTVVLFAGKKVELASDLIKLLWRQEPGDTVEVVFSRNGAQVKATITLGQKAQSSAI